MIDNNTDEVSEKLKEAREALSEETVDKINEVEEAFNECVARYESEIEDLKGIIDDRDSEIAELNDKIEEIQSTAGDLEDYAAKMLQAFTGHEPSMGEVLSLKEDLEKLLTTKYNISLGNL